MWTQSVGWLIAALGVAASANLLIGRRTRSLRSLKAEADLHAVLPGSPAKDELAQHLEVAVRRHLELSKSGRAPQSSRIGALADLVAGFVLIPMATLILFGNLSKSTGDLLTWIGGGVAVSAMTVEYLTRRHARESST